MKRRFVTATTARQSGHGAIPTTTCCSGSPIPATKGYTQRVIDHAWIFVEVGTLLEQMAPPSLNFDDEMAIGAASKGLELYRTGGWCAVLDYSNTLRQYK